jgi:hypothetical protein
MITAIIVGGVLLFGGGVGLGVALNRDRTADAIEAQTAMIGEIQDGQRALVEAAGRPVVIDAEVRASLAEVPPACVEALGGSPLSAQCLLMACWQYGQSAAQRPDCDSAEQLAVEALQAPTQAPQAAP